MVVIAALAMIRGIRVWMKRRATAAASASAIPSAL
jgi:hypothetical protein